MKRAAIGVLSLLLVSCDMPQPSARETLAAEGAAKADAAVRSNKGNGDQANIARRLRLTSQPGLLGYIVLLNEAGQPILYTSVTGKVTSSGKRLTAPVKFWSRSIDVSELGAAPSDEGTWGSSDPYIYFWTTDGQYMQWNGPYLYSNSPIRLSIQPLVVDVGTPAPEPVAEP